MRESAQTAEKQANFENEAHKGSNANKDRSKDKISNMATLDSGTMVQAFKYLNYCQLAKKSLVSKRFRNLIQTHRHSLALFYVDTIVMHSSSTEPAAIQVFDKELTAEAYNEWVILNGYSKQAPLQDQIVSTQNIPSDYRFYAYANYNDPNNRGLCSSTSVFSAQVKLNDDNWPVFQHFVRLVTDSFIYIDWMELTPQNDVLNLLSGSINSDRLQCKKLIFNQNGNSQKSITWAKNHVRCNGFYICGEADLNHDEAMLDFILTGAHCTPEVKLGYLGLSKVMVDFLQKFMELKNSDESNLVEAIEGNFKYQDTELLKRDYAEFLVKEERYDRSNMHIYELVNDNIGKKLQLTAKSYGSLMSVFSIKISNL